MTAFVRNKYALKSNGHRHTRERGIKHKLVHHRPIVVDKPRYSTLSVSASCQDEQTYQVSVSEQEYWIASDFCSPTELRWLLAFEYVHFVRGLAFLCDNRLLTSIDDEVSSLIVNTLSNLRQTLRTHFIKITSTRTQHCRNLRIIPLLQPNHAETVVHRLGCLLRFLRSITGGSFCSLCHFNEYRCCIC